MKPLTIHDSSSWNSELFDAISELHSAQKLLHDFSEINQLSLSKADLQKADKLVLEYRYVFAYHATKLTEKELFHIRRFGLSNNPVILEKVKLDVLKNIKLYDPVVLNSISGLLKDYLTDESRRGLIHFSDCPDQAKNGNQTLSLMRYWGGDALHFAFLELGLDLEDLGFGDSYLIECALDLSDSGNRKNISNIVSQMVMAIDGIKECRYLVSESALHSRNLVNIKLNSLID